MEASHNAIKFVMSDETEYVKTKRLGLKTSIRKGERFFSESEAPMKFMRGWDNKRRLLSGGHTAPWLDVGEYDFEMNKRHIDAVRG